jgi:hypothetical protein
MAKSVPTKRAADWWDSAAFSGIFLASSFFCSQAESTPAHQRLPITCSVKGSEKIRFSPHIYRPPVSFPGGFFFFLCLIFLIWGTLRHPKPLFASLGVAG